MFVRLTETSNRALLYDLYPYVWDVKEVLQLLDTFVNWLSTKNKRKKQKGQSFYPEDPEPWVFRGGLCGELQVCCTVRCMCSRDTACSSQVAVMVAFRKKLSQRFLLNQAEISSLLASKLSIVSCTLNINMVGSKIHHKHSCR